MDTRDKIITPDRIPQETAQGEWCIVVGTFDPLTADVALYFQELSRQEPPRKLLALILPAPSANLPAEARAALIAALRSTDRVCIGTLADLPTNSSHWRIVADAAADGQRSQAFVHRVLERQKAVDACTVY